MAQSPQFKVYDKGGTYQAATKEIDVAAVVAQFYGEGSTVRLGHGSLVLWTNGENPGASYDEIATLAEQRRIAAIRKFQSS